MDKYKYRSFKATCLYQKDTPYQDKSAYDEFNKKIQEYLGKKDFLSWENSSRTNNENFYRCSYYTDRFFIQNLHVLYFFLLVFPDNDRDLSFKDCVLSRAIKLESGVKPFVPFLPLDFYYSLQKREEFYSSQLSDEAYLIYYSPETGSFLYERYSGCDDIFHIYACTLNKDYRLPPPLSFEKVSPGGIHDINFYPKGFNCFLFNSTISGKYEEDKDKYIFKYSKPDPRYDSRHPNPMFLDPISCDNPHSFWLNFYKHFGEFNIYDFKKLIKRNALEIHSFDDSSFDKFNDNPILQRLLFRDNEYPTGYIRYRSYSFFSKGDDMDENKSVILPSKRKNIGKK